MSPNIQLLAQTIESKSQLMEMPKVTIDEMKNEILSKLKILFRGLDNKDDETVCEQIPEICFLLLTTGLKFNKFDVYGKKISKYISQE